MRDGLLGCGDDLQSSILGCTDTERMNLLPGLWFKRECKQPKKRLARRCISMPLLPCTKMQVLDRNQSVMRHTETQMKAVYEKYPDDETKLFYGLSILARSKKAARI